MEAKSLTDADRRTIRKMHDVRNVQVFVERSGPHGMDYLLSGKNAAGARARAWWCAGASLEALHWEYAGRDCGGQEVWPDAVAVLTVPQLKTRGWTDSLIRRHLGDPDAWVDNPHYKSGPGMRLYVLTHVRACEHTPAWIIARGKAQERQERASAISARKAEELATWVERLTITVPHLAPDDLVQQACAHYNAGAHVPDHVWERREREEQYLSPATPDSDPRFLARIIVNFLRHRMTDYEQLLEKAYGKSGAGMARLGVTQKVYAALAEAYPQLAAECARQYAEREERESWRER